MGAHPPGIANRPYGGAEIRIARCQLRTASTSPCPPWAINSTPASPRRPQLPIPVPSGCPRTTSARARVGRNCGNRARGELNLNYVYESPLFRNLLEGTLSRHQREISGKRLDEGSLVAQQRVREIKGYAHCQFAQNRLELLRGLHIECAANSTPRVTAQLQLSIC